MLASTLAGPLPKEVELDEVQDPETTFHVLDADAGQRLCLEAAARGQSFAMLGPNGSGKTQTLVNMIAGGMARGKRVLIVSDKPGSLERIANELRRAGLGACCDASGTLPPAAPSTGLVDLASLKRQRERLAAHVRALHSVRKPLGRSVWSVIAELTGLRALPVCPPGLALSRAGLETAEQLVVVTELAPVWLEEAMQAVRRLQQLWPLRGQQDFPWRGFKSDKYNKQLRDDVVALIDRIRARLDRLLTVGDQYGTQVGCKGEPVRRLLKLGELLDSAPSGIPEHWLKGDIAAVAHDLEHCAGEYGRLGQAREPLTTRYGVGIWTLPEGTAAAVERAWQAAAPLLPANDERGAGVLAQQQALRGWAADTQRRIPGWITEARVLEKWLAVALPRGRGAEPDQTKPDPASVHLRHLQRLANLCMSDHPPERTWVHQAGALESARTQIASDRPKFVDYQERRRKLLETYKESLFDLDVPRIAAAFAGPYRAWWRVLKGQFRQDRRAIRRRTHALVVPAAMAEDMQAARELLDCRARLEGEAETRRAVLGRYEKGLETNFDTADRAVRVAAEAADLVRQLGYEALPARFMDVLCGGGAPPEKIRAAAKRLHDSLGAWLHATHELKAHLPMETLPATSAALEESALSALNQYARDLQTALNQFAAVTDSVLAHAPAPPGDAVTLAADLRQAEAVRFWEATHATEGPRWQARFGAGFQGVTTDWELLKRKLAWTKHAHEFFQGVPPDRFCQLACAEAGMRPSSQELRNALEQYEQALHGLEIRFEAPGAVFDGKRLAEHPPEIVKQRLATMRDRVGELLDWVDWRYLPVRLGHLGLGIFWEELKRNPPAAGQIVDIFRKAFWSCWLEATLQQEPVLAEFKRAKLEHVREEFARLDRDWLRANAQRVLARLASSGMAGPPCCLLPCEEAALMPSETHFDLLIFAAAEKTGLEEGMEAMARAKQIIIAGDETEAPGPENTGRSLLDACAASGLPTHRLGIRYGTSAGVATDPSELGPVEADIIAALAVHGCTARAGVHCGDIPIDLAVLQPGSSDRYALAIELDGPRHAAAATVRDRERLHGEVLERNGWKVHRIWALDWLFRRDEEIARLHSQLPIE